MASDTTTITVPTALVEAVREASCNRVPPWPEHRRYGMCAAQTEALAGMLDAILAAPPAPAGVTVGAGRSIEDVGIPTDPFIYGSSGIAQFEIGKHRVQVSPAHSRDDAKTLALANLLRDHAGALVQAGVAVAGWRRQCEERDEQIVTLRSELADLRARHPKTPARILATGCVRFDERGGLWLLSRRETGWSAFGIPCAGWDELFRRFNVRVTAQGSDEHGPWWAVENAS